MRVVGAAADQVGLGLELGEALRVDPGHEAGHLAHHLGADAVAGEQQKLIGRHGCTAPLPFPLAGLVLDRPGSA